MEKLLIGGRATVWDVRAELFGADGTDHDCVYRRSPERIRHLWVHHTAVPYERGWRIVDQVAHLQALARGAHGRLCHVDGVFPYNFAVFPGGRRFYTGDVDTARPHTFAFNDDVAVVFIGNFEEVEASRRTLRAAGRLLEAIPYIWHPEPPGWPVYGHQEGYTVLGVARNNTACPGRHIMEWLRGWRGD